MQFWALEKLFVHFLLDEVQSLLEEFTIGFAFDERLQQQLNYEQMIALSDMLTGWALGTEFDQKRSAWLAGFSEGLIAEANQLGPDWNPPEPEKLTLIGYMGYIANGDKVKPEQLPSSRYDEED
jgi:hypothetical protein